MDSFDKQMEMVLYHSAEGDVSVDAYIVDESLWITQKSMAKLFGIDKSGISRHLNKIFKSGELKKEVVVAKFATTNPHGAIEGKTQENEEYMTKGFVLDDDRLKQGKTAFGKDNRLLISLRNAALTILRIQKWHIISMPLYKTSFITQLLIIQRLRLCTNQQTIIKNIWDSLHGKMHRMDEF